MDAADILIYEFLCKITDMIILIRFDNAYTPAMAMTVYPAGISVLS